MNFRDFLVLASNLSNGTTEAEWRSAVSRAYYAAFHAAQAVLFLEGIKARTHSGVVNQFGLLLVKSGKVDAKYGKFLSNLKEDREVGDYEVYAPIEEEDARNALKEAEEFVKEMERYTKPDA